MMVVYCLEPDCNCNSYFSGGLVRINLIVMLFLNEKNKMGLYGFELLALPALLFPC